MEEMLVYSPASLLEYASTVRESSTATNMKLSTTIIVPMQRLGGREINS